MARRLLVGGESGEHRIALVLRALGKPFGEVGEIILPLRGSSGGDDEVAGMRIELPSSYGSGKGRARCRAKAALALGGNGPSGGSSAGGSRRPGSPCASSLVRFASENASLVSFAERAAFFGRFSAYVVGSSRFTLRQLDDRERL